MSTNKLTKKKKLSVTNALPPDPFLKQVEKKTYILHTYGIHPKFFARFARENADAHQANTKKHTNTYKIWQTHIQKKITDNNRKFNAIDNSSQLDLDEMHNDTDNDNDSDSDYEEPNRRSGSANGVTQQKKLTKELKNIFKYHIEYIWNNTYEFGAGCYGSSPQESLHSALVEALTKKGCKSLETTAKVACLILFDRAYSLLNAKPLFKTRKNDRQMSKISLYFAKEMYHILQKKNTKCLEIVKTTGFFFFFFFFLFAFITTTIKQQKQNTILPKIPNI